MRKYYGILGLLIVTVMIIMACSSTAPTTTVAPKPTTAAPAPTTTAAPKPTTAAPTPSATPSSTQPIVNIDFATHITATMAQATTINTWIDTVAKRTNGAVKIKAYYSGTLFPQAELWNAVSSGKAGAGFLTDSLSPEPVLGWMEAYYFNLDSIQHQDKAMQAGINEITKLAYLKRNVQPITPLLFASTSIGNSKRTVKLPTDLKGLKLRVYNTQLAAFCEKAGAVGVSLGDADTYLGIQRGTIDGYFTTADSVISRSLYEVAKYYTDVFMRSSPITISVNLDVWKKLTPEQQKIMLDAGAEGHKAEVDMVIASQDSLIKQIGAKGVEIYKPTAADLKQWASFSAFLRDDFKKNVGDDVYTKINNFIEQAR